MNKESPVYIIIFMIIVCVVFSLAVSAVNYMTADMLERNEKLHRNRIIVKAFMLPAQNDTPRAYEDIINKNIEPFTIKSTDGDIEVYRNKNNGDVGFVFKGNGFWDIIRGIIVLSENLNEIKNIQILEQKETPGLGARIEELSFTDQFKGIRITPQVGESTYITLDQSSPERINAITGATQTSIALVSVINSQLKIFILHYKKSEAGI